MNGKNKTLLYFGIFNAFSVLPTFILACLFSWATLICLSSIWNPVISDAFFFTYAVYSPPFSPFLHLGELFWEYTAGNEIMDWPASYFQLLAFCCLQA